MEAYKENTWYKSDGGLLFTVKPNKEGSRAMREAAAMVNRLTVRVEAANGTPEIEAVLLHEQLHQYLTTPAAAHATAEMDSLSGHVPCFVRPAGDYAGWCLVAENDRAQDAEGKAMDFACFSDEDAARGVAALLNRAALPTPDQPLSTTPRCGGVGEWVSADNGPQKHERDYALHVLMPNNEVRVATYLTSDEAESIDENPDAGWFGWDGDVYTRLAPQPSQYHPLPAAPKSCTTCTATGNTLATGEGEKVVESDVYALEEAMGEWRNAGSPGTVEEHLACTTLAESYSVAVLVAEAKWRKL